MNQTVLSLSCALFSHISTLEWDPSKLAHHCDHLDQLNTTL